MKIGFCTLLTPEYALTDVIPHALRWGFDGIEWRIADAGEPQLGQVNYALRNRCSIPPQQVAVLLPEIVRRARDAGLESPSVSPYLTCLQERDAEPIMAAMADAGVHLVRVNAPPYDRQANYRTQFDLARAAYERIARLAARHGVRACVEQHHYNLTPSASACFRLVEHLDPAHVGVIVNTGNVLVEGYEQFGMVVDLLGEYLAMIHVKNGILVPAKTTPAGHQRYEPLWGPLDTGMINLDLLAQTLHHAPWSGWLILEDFSNRPTDIRLTEGARLLRHLAHPTP